MQNQIRASKLVWPPIGALFFSKKNPKISQWDRSLLLSLLEGSVSKRAEQFFFKKKEQKRIKRIPCDDILPKFKNNNYL
jgi:hypothetical protein